MNRLKPRAFTLIELLVVIAIIAILAAILFPVFAQAKRAAKGSVAISDAKQIGLGQLMYTNDFDDMIPPVVEFQKGSWTVEPFTYLQQPYMKSWGVLLDPTGPIVPSSVVGSGDKGDSFAMYGLWGMGPRQAATDGSFSNYTFGTSATGKLMTGGQTYLYDGIGGVANVANAGDREIWSQWGYQLGQVPSLTTTAIANPADQILLAQSANYDFMWQQDNADSFDLYFSSCGDNTYGCQLAATAPLARQRDTDGPTVGLYKWPGGTPTQEPTGLTVWVGVDGHAKASSWRQLMGTTVTTSNGQKAIKAFWPSGS